MDEYYRIVSMAQRTGRSPETCVWYTIGLNDMLHFGFYYDKFTCLSYSTLIDYLATTITLDCASIQTNTNPSSFFPLSFFSSVSLSLPSESVKDLVDSSVSLESSLGS